LNAGGGYVKDDDHITATFGPLDPTNPSRDRSNMNTAHIYVGPITWPLNFDKMRIVRVTWAKNNREKKTAKHEIATWWRRDY
jgi:hypothetical protein